MSDQFAKFAGDHKSSQTDRRRPLPQRYSKEDNDNDDSGLPTVEEVLRTALREEGFPVEDPSLNTVRGVEEVALDKRGVPPGKTKCSPERCSSSGHHLSRYCFLPLRGSSLTTDECIRIVRSRSGNGMPLTSPGLESGSYPRDR